MLSPELITAQRLQLAAWVLIASFFLPLLATLNHSSMDVNLVAALCQLFFVLTVVPETAREIDLSWRKDRLLILAGVLLAITGGGWLNQSASVLDNPRTYVYLSVPLFFFALLGWMRGRPDERMLIVYQSKLGAVVLALAWITMFLHMPALAELKNHVKSDPPIYRHLRHMNYDLAMVIPLAMLFWPSRGRMAQLGYGFLFIMFGYFSVWSAGRGQGLALAVFGLLMLAFRALRLSDPVVIKAAISSLVGAAIVFVVGETQLIFNTVSQTIGSDSVQTLSSGRTRIWSYLLGKLIENDGLWFGMGPEGVLALKSHWGIYIQAHNFIVQWLVEFGIVGTAGLVLIVGRMAWGALKHLRTHRQFSLGTTVSALFLSTLCFALFDGQFYHGIPLTMLLIFAAYLAILRQEGDQEHGEVEVYKDKSLRKRGLATP